VVLQVVVQEVVQVVLQEVGTSLPQENFDGSNLFWYPRAHQMNGAVTPPHTPSSGSTAGPRSSG